MAAKGQLSAAPATEDSLNLSGMPDALRLVVEAAYGEATGIVFTVSAAVAVIAFVCIVLIKEVPLRKTI